ncbi:hypothetical protein TrispH2_007099 [Trichoplax sp. H2]|nr:hypothetical protein TrispH2_007099 [Trichoplax sp. H2]|eukprot:RDD40534.1 hypothetical protein TrispH2_007099 [Trichoplax sp. H2]
MQCSNVSKDLDAAEIFSRRQWEEKFNLLPSILNVTTMMEFSLRFTFHKVRKSKDGCDTSFKATTGCNMENVNVCRCGQSSLLMTAPTK